LSIRFRLDRGEPVRAAVDHGIDLRLDGFLGGLPMCSTPLFGRAQEKPMTLCPIAIVAGCRKCPAYKVCPLKSVIGDQPSAGAAPPPATKPAPRKKR
jgi:hypothetical protein